MLRCISCEQPDQRIEILAGDPWCHVCIYEGKFAAFLEAQALVAAILAERARRVPTPRDDKRFKPAERRNDEKV
jgi:hypothetical protein